MQPFPTSPNLDDLLLDIATVIELSDNDRMVAASRYKKLKEHLERPISALRPYLVDDDSRIYAQGSMAIGATIVTGTDDDRFDVDAIVEINVPRSWSPSDVLDKLEQSLQGFPDVMKIVRRTRCIQLQFAFMHMDVTILDPSQEPRMERTGDIFHSPDSGDGERVPSNPYGFACWVRTNTVAPVRDAEPVRERRALSGIDRLVQGFRAAEQEELPPSVPPRIDVQQIVSLKLMKRFLNLRYEERHVKKPPSIYITKTAVDCDFEPMGLCTQLERQARYVASEMEKAIAAKQRPR
jgi:Second Messenger Oligonucleotide or Dinucleotide Synthetase domain